MKRLEKISVLTAKLKKAVAEEGIGGLAGRTKGYLARAKKEKEFQREKSRVYRDILFISGCNEQLPHPHRYRVVHQMEQLEAGGYTCDTVYFQELKPWMVRRVRDFPLPDDGHPAGICHNGKADEQASVVRCG